MAQQGDPIAEVVAEIGEVKRKIADLEEQIKALEEKEEKGVLTDKGEKKLEQLREEKTALINKETELLKKESRLSAAAANSAGASTTGFKRRYDGSPCADELPAKKTKVDLVSLGDAEAKLPVLRTKLEAFAEKTQDLSLPCPYVVPFPSLSVDVPERFHIDSSSQFSFFGRERFSELLALMRQLLQQGKVPAQSCVMRAPAGETHVLKVYGSAGFGKSHMIAVAVAQLLGEGHPVVYIPEAGKLKSSSALEIFVKAFAVAYPQRIAELRDCSDVDELRRVTSGWGRTLFVVDQLNSLEYSVTDPADAEAKKRGSELVELIVGLSPSVFGYSANNRTAAMIAQKQRTERDFLCFGGFAQREFEAWCDICLRAFTADDRALLVPFLRDDLGKMPMLLYDALDAITQGTESLASRMSAYSAAYVENIVGALRVFYTVLLPEGQRPFAVKFALDVVKGVKNGPMANSDMYDHRFFFSFPDATEPGVSRYRAVSGLALAALVHVVRTVLQASEQFFHDATMIHACQKNPNPVVRGFLVEQVVISFIQQHGLSLGRSHRPKPARVVSFTGRFPDAFLGDSDACVQFVPAAFNYKFVDSVIVEVAKASKGTSKKRGGATTSGTIYAVQVTLQRIQDHVRSLEFFSGDSAKPFQETAATVSSWNYVMVWIVRDAEAASWEAARRSAKTAPQPALPNVQEYCVQLSVFDPKFGVI
eukprot:Opistho-1_new@77382